MKKLISLLLLVTLSLFILSACGITSIGYTTVNFETYGGGYFPSRNYKAGQLITVDETPYKYGYRFVSWYFDAELTESIPAGVVSSSFTETTWYAGYEIDESVLVHSIPLFSSTTVEQVYAGHSYYLIRKTSSAPIQSITITPSNDPMGDPDSIELIRSDGRPIADTNPDPAVYTPEDSTAGAADYVLIIHSKNLGYFILTINN